MAFGCGEEELVSEGRGVMGLGGILSRAGLGGRVSGVGCAGEVLSGRGRFVADTPEFMRSG